MRRTAWAGRLSAALVGLLAVTGCGASSLTRVQKTPTTTNATLTLTPPGRDPSSPCRGTGADECFSASNGVPVALSTRTPSAGLVLVDLAGPASSAVDLPGSSGAGVDLADVRASLPAWLNGYTLAVVLASSADWTLTPACQPYFAALSWQRPAEDPAGVCADLVSYYAQPDLSFTLAEVQRHTRQALAGIVAFSFGATRTRPLWSRLDPASGFLLVITPAPATGSPMDAVVAEQAGRAREALAAQLAMLCRTWSGCLSVDDLLARAAATGNDPAWGVSGAEISLFLLAAAADPGPNAGLLGALARDRPLTDADRAALRRVTLATARSTAVDRAQSSNVDERAQLCQAYGPFGAAAPADPLARALVAQLGPCTKGATGWSPAPVTGIPARSCLLLNTADSVVGPSGAKELTALFGTARVRRYAVPAHAWTAQTTQLVQAVGSAAAPSSAAGGSSPTGSGSPSATGSPSPAGSPSPGAGGSGWTC